jgi:hypothetical protein
VVHCVNQVTVDSNFNNLKPLTRFEVTLDNEVDNFEIRCEVSKNFFIQLDKVEIKVLSSLAPLLKTQNTLPQSNYIKETQ